MIRHSLRALGLGALIVTAAVSCLAQEVIVPPGAGRNLETRTQEALSKASERQFTAGFWVGYSIDRQMGANEYVGSHYADVRRNRPTLEEVVTGVRAESSDKESRSGDLTIINGTMFVGDDGRGREKIVKEIGILAHFAGRNEPDEVVVSNLSLHVELKQQPLFWLGSAGQGESVSWLSFLFGTAAGAREDIVAAIGLHDPSEAVVTFLGRVARGDEPRDVRESAIFWLGQTGSKDALVILMAAARGDRSGNIREQAVFAVSEMDREEAVDSLIHLARHAGEKDVRKQAVFWLGQKASRKTTAALKEAVGDDADAEVQKSALYALGQLEGDEGLDTLIEIATRHRNPELRKAAIYLIGESDDPRAVEALVSLVRN